MKRCLFIACLVFVIPFISFAGTPGTQKWAFTTGDYVSSSPAIGYDGTIYFGSNDKNLYAVNPDGTKKWAFATGGTVRSSPAIGYDGMIYFGSADKKLYAIKPDGTQKWAFTTGDYGGFSSPAIGSDGTIYVGSYDKNLYAANPDGTKKWAFTTGDYVTSSPVIGSDGTVYISSWDRNLYAVNPNGTQKWAVTIGISANSSPAIGSDGTIYVGSDNKKLYAINPDGTQKWTFATGKDVASPVIGSDGTVYIRSWDKNLYAVNPNGTQKWAVTIGNLLNSSPAIGSDGTIYVGSDDKKLYAINPDGTQKWTFATGNDVASPAIGVDGTIYVGSYDKNLYAIYSDSMGLAQSSWPKFHANNMNTGLSGGTPPISSLFVSDTINFAFFNAGGINQKSLSVNNPNSTEVIITNCQWDHPAFSLDSALPISLPSGTSSLKVNIRPFSTGFYQSTMQLTYQIQGESKTVSQKVSAGLFLEDGGETAYTAHQALNAYNACYAADPNLVATKNNLGILYRLLKETDTADTILLETLSNGLNAKDSYGGIKMNSGVVKSDKGSSADADKLYASAVKDITSNESQSALAPQLYYDQAWEAYKSKNLSGAMTSVNKTINHAKSNEYLKAKAYVLRGVIYFSQNDTSAANSDFQMANTLDSAGPIGRIARNNLSPADCISVANNLDLNMCAEYQGILYGFTMNYSPNNLDPYGLYWKMNSGTFGQIQNSSGKCLKVGDDLTLNMCAEYQSVIYDVILKYNPIQNDPSGLYWKMDVFSFAKKP